MFSFKLYAQLPSGPDELREHVDALSKMAEAREHQKVFDHLYNCLSILDSKSSSLLAFNSIITAVFAIFMTSDLPWREWIIISFGMAAVLISSLLLLTVVWVHWSTTKDLRNIEGHALTLLGVRRRRTVQYRVAWYCAMLAVFSLCVLLLQRILDRVVG